MRHTARLLLERRIARRTFISRLAALGVGGPAASALARSLLGAPSTRRARLLEQVSGGEVMAEFLLEWGISHVFGLGGSEEVGFLDALVDRTKLSYVLALHEGSVLAMADGYARASGRTALANLHSVVGTANALGPLVNAFKDRTPLVVTAGRQSTRIRGRGAFLESVHLDQLPREYTRWTWDVLRPETIAESLRRAFLLAEVPPGGPTFLTFSKDLWEARLRRAQILPRGRSRIQAALDPDPAQVARLAGLLGKAEFPVLLAGRQLAGGGAGLLRRLAQVLGAPVFSDIPASHSPLSYPTRDAHYCGLFTEDPAFPRGFDLFFSVGGSMFRQFHLPKEPLVPHRIPIIHLGTDPPLLARNYPVDLALLADIPSTLAALLEQLERHPPSGTALEERRRRVEEYHHRRRATLEKRARQLWSQTPIASERLALELNRRLAPEAIVVSELATSDKFLWEYLDFAAEGGRRHITSSGGCLGWGVGAAIGARMAEPAREVVALLGDGSLQFGIQGLWSAARYQVPVAFIVWNNGAYQANRRALARYGGRAAATGHYIGCTLTHPDIDHAAIARGYGIEAQKVEQASELPAALERCLGAVRRGEPYLLDVHIQPLFSGADSEWYDFFSVAGEKGRKQ